MAVAGLAAAVDAFLRTHAQPGAGKPGGTGQLSGAVDSAAEYVERPSRHNWMRCALSQAAPLVGDARHSQASVMTSASSLTVSSPSRLARSSTDGCPSKCAVVKNGAASSWIIDCLSASDGTQNMITSR